MTRTTKERVTAAGRLGAREAQPPSRAPDPCLTCEQCGLALEHLALRCPRCAAPMALGCTGSCRECGARHR